jgi:hypothetical protein
MMTVRRLPIRLRRNADAWRNEVTAIAAQRQNGRRIHLVVPEDEQSS